VFYLLFWLEFLLVGMERFRIVSVNYVHPCTAVGRAGCDVDFSRRVW